MAVADIDLAWRQVQTVDPLRDDSQKGDGFLGCFDDCDFVRGRRIRGAVLYRMMRVVRGQRIQDGFHAVGDAELVVDAEEVIFYGVLAELQYSGQFGVAETVG